MFYEVFTAEEVQAVCDKEVALKDKLQVVLTAIERDADFINDELSEYGNEEEAPTEQLYDINEKLFADVLARAIDGKIGFTPVDFAEALIDGQAQAEMDYWAEQYYTSPKKMTEYEIRDVYQHNVNKRDYMLETI